MAVVGDFAPEDQAAVRALVPAGLQERWGEAFNPGLNPDLDDLTANSLDRGAEIVVIDNTTQIVATGTLSVPHPGAPPERMVREAPGGRLLPAHSSPHFVEIDRLVCPVDGVHEHRPLGGDGRAYRSAHGYDLSDRGSGLELALQAARYPRRLGGQLAGEDDPELISSEAGGQAGGIRWLVGRH